MAENIIRYIIKMKLKFILTFMVTCTVLHYANAQETDYMKMREKIAVLGCGDFDTATLFNAHRKLIKVDTNSITANKNQYFKDLAWSNYNLAAHVKDSMLMENAIFNWRRAWQMDNKDFLSLWNLCNALAFNKHCIELDSLVPKLVKIIPRRNRKGFDTEELLQSCHLQGWWFKV